MRNYSIQPKSATKKKKKKNLFFNLLTVLNDSMREFCKIRRSKISMFEKQQYFSDRNTTNLLNASRKKK